MSENSDHEIPGSGNDITDDDKKELSANNDVESKSVVTDSPKRGQISTSTGSFEPLDQHDPNISRLATKLFEKTSDYLTAELNTTCDDYKLLEKMNNLTTAKYSDMCQITNNIALHMDELNDKYKEVQPLLDNLTCLMESVSKLEDMAYKLDAYSKRLEDKFKNLEKRYQASLVD